MQSILVNARQKAAVVLSSLVETHAADVGKAIEHMLGAYLREGEVLPNVTFLIVLLGRMVAAAAAKLLTWQRVRCDEVDGGVEPRLQRDLAAQELRRKMIDARALVTALYGSKRGSEIFGLVGRLPRARQPESLWKWALALVDRLRDPNLEAPATMFKNAFRPAQLARELETCATALRQALDAVEREQRQVDSTLAARDEAMSELVLIHKACVPILKGFFALAGRPDLARKLAAQLRRKKSPEPERRCGMKT